MKLSSAFRLILTSVVLLFGLQASISQADAIRLGQVSGKIQDAQSKDAIPQTNVVLLRASDNAYIASVQTNADGSFRFRNVPFGHYKVQATVLGYEKLQPVFQLNARQPQQELGTVALVPMPLPVFANTPLIVTPGEVPASNASKVGRAGEFVLANASVVRTARPMVRL